MTNLWKSSVNKSFPDQHDKKENSTVDSSVPSYRDKNTSASLVKKVHVNQSYFRHVSLQHVRHPLLGQQEPSRAVVDNDTEDEEGTISVGRNSVLNLDFFFYWANL